MLISKKMTVRDFFRLCDRSTGRGTAAAALLSVIMGGTTSLFANGYDSESTFGTSMEMALLIEIVLTFIFVTAVLSVKKEDENITVTAAVSGAALALVSLFRHTVYRYISESGQIAGSCAVSGRRGDQPGLGLHRGAFVGAYSCRLLLDLFMKREPEEENGAELKGKRIGRRRCGRS